MANQSARAIIRIGAMPDSSLKRVMRGVVDSSRATSKQVTSDAKKEAKAYVATERMKARESERIAVKTARDVLRHSAKMRREQTKQAQKQAAEELRIQQELEADKVREARRAAAKMARETEKNLRAQVRLAEKAAREESRARVRARKAEEKRRERVRGALAGAAGGAALGAVRAVDQYTSQAQSRLGVSDPGDTIQTAKRITDSMVISMSQAGFSSEEIVAALEKIDATAKAQTVSQEKLANAVVFGQERFSDPGFVLEMLPDLAKIARASGGSEADVAGVAGVGLTMKEKFGLTNEEAKRVLYSMFSQTGEGAIEFGDLSGALAPTLAQIQNKTGGRGEAAALEASALVQVLGKSLKNSAEVGTIAERFVGSITKKTTQDKLREVGVDIADSRTGELKGSLADVFASIATAPKLQNAQTRQKVFNELLGEEGAATVIKAQAADPELFTRLAQSSPEEGSRVVELVNERLDASPFSKIDQMQIAAQSVTLSGELVDTIIGAAKARSDLATEHPALFEAMGPIANILGGAGIGALLGGGLKRLVFGSATAAGGAAAEGGAAALAGTGAAGAAGTVGALGIAGASAVGLLTGLLTSKVLEWTGAEDAIIQDGYDWAGPSIPRSTARGTGPDVGEFVRDLASGGAAAAPISDTDAKQIGEHMAEALVRKHATRPNRLEIAVTGPARVTDLDGADLDMSVETGYTPGGF